MGSLSNFAENELLDHLFNAAYPSPTAVYLAFCTGDPTDAGTGASMNEAADANGYARTAIVFSAPGSRAIIQNGDVDFPEASGAWGTITHWAVLDGNTHGAGNMLAHGAFGTSFAPVNGNTPTVATTEVTISIAATATGAGFTDWAVHGLLNLMFRNTAFTTTADNTFVLLMTATADDQDVDTDDLTECAVANGYARVEVNANGGAAPTWDLAAAGVVDNTGVITMGPPSGSWGLVTSMAICDATSGTANVICYDNTNIVDQTPVNGDTVTFAAGALDLTLT